MIFHTQIKKNNVLSKGNRTCNGPTVRPGQLVGGMKSSVRPESGGQSERQGDEDTTAGGARHEGRLSVMEDTAGF